MMRITLRLRHAESIPIDCSGLLPGPLASATQLELERWPVLVGNRRIELKGLCEIERVGDAIDDRNLLIFDGCWSRGHYIGAGMTCGEIEVRGRAGRHAGARMSGGTLTIAGRVGDYFAAEMSGGTAWCQNSGDFTAASCPGSRVGMTGGKIVIAGTAGRYLGQRMKRGLIHVHGDTGDYCGTSMIGGTIVCDGAFGDYPGANMKRGTLIAHRPLSQFAPGFHFCCAYKPVFLNLLLGRLGKASSESRLVRCHRGDLLTGGRGEIWEIRDAEGPR